MGYRLTFYVALTHVHETVAAYVLYIAVTTCIEFVYLHAM